MHLIYLASGFWGRNSANNIQTGCMYEALVDTLQPKEASYLIRREHFRIKFLFTDYLNKIISGIVILLEFLGKIINFYKKNSVSKNSLIIYSRLILIPLILSIFLPRVKVYIELHNNINILQKFFLKLFGKNTKFTVISITHKLASEISKQTGLCNIIVAPDAHNFQLLHQVPKEHINSPPTYGYFGALTHQKGVSQLLELKTLLKDRLKIYSRVSHEIHWKFALDAKYLEHRSVREEMLKCDFLIVFNVESDHTSIDKYTSPLKLFEYAACCKPIIYNFNGALEEILDDTNSIGIDINMPNWARELVDQCDNFDAGKYSQIANALLELSRSHTYKMRVKKIFKGLY